MSRTGFAFLFLRIYGTRGEMLLFDMGDSKRSIRTGLHPQNLGSAPTEILSRNLLFPPRVLIL